MAVGYVQHTHFTINSASSGNATLTGFTAGNLVALIMSKLNTTERAFTVTDSQSGTLTQAVLNEAATGRQSGIWYLANRGSGNLTVMLSVVGGFYVNAECTIVELSGVDNSSPIGGTSTFANPNSLTHYAADVTGFNPLADSLVLAVTTGNAANTTAAVASPYTGILELASGVGGTGHAAHSYRAVASNLTNERPQTNLTGTNRNGPGVCCWFRAAAAVSGSPARLINGGVMRSPLANGGLVG